VHLSAGHTHESNVVRGAKRVAYFGQVVCEQICCIAVLTTAEFICFLFLDVFTVNVLTKKYYKK